MPRPDYSVFSEIEYDDELEYDLALKERASFDNFDDGVYAELDDEFNGLSEQELINNDDEDFTDDELNQMEARYYDKINEDDDDELYTVDRISEDYTFNDIGSLSGYNFDDMPLFAHNNALPSPITKKRHFSLKTFLSNLHYSGAGCLFYRKENGRTFILLEKRASGMRYGNQWTIPGGGAEPKDECRLDTALRETDEEIDHFHKGFAKKYFNVADKLHTSRWFTYRYDYFIIKADNSEADRIWGPDPAEVSQVRWFNIKILPKHCHKSIRWLIFLAKLKNLIK